MPQDLNEKMTSRKAAFKEDKPSNKKQRIAFVSDTNVRAFFDDLNNDCVLQILTFLPVDDINTFGVISRRYHLIRRHESLDQTRIATITCSESSSRRSLRQTLQAASRVLSANYTHLKLLEFDAWGPGVAIELLPPHVTKLELSLASNEQLEDRRLTDGPFIRNLLPVNAPKIRELMLHGISNKFIFCVGLKQLVQVTHVGGGTVDMSGWNYRSAPVLTSLTLDNCLLVCRTSAFSRAQLKQEVFGWFSREGDEGGSFMNTLMGDCRHLQRLSMKGATWTVLNNSEVFFQPEPIPQEMLVKMVRHHPTLRWLRSDLSDDNVEMMKQERPEITFVSE